MIKNAVIAIMFISLFGCKGDDKPDNVLKEDKMAEILLDIYLSETEFADLKMHRDTTLLLFDLYESRLFDKHGVSEDDYMASMTYYYNHPDELDYIYEAIMDTLTLRETILKAEEETEKDKQRVEAEAKIDSQKVDAKPKSIKEK